MISKNQIDNLISLVKDLGKEVEIIKSRNINHETKSDGSPLTEADKFVNENLIKFIKKTNFQNIISEECKELIYEQRKLWDYYWVIDPIDGTKEFIKKGDDYTINIALCYKNIPLFGIVYAPATKDLFFGAKGKGAFKNGKKISVNKSFKEKIYVVASKSHLNSKTAKFIKDLEKKYLVNLINIGSSLKVCLVAEGKADLYPRYAPTMEWDICAAHIILKEAGGDIWKADDDYNDDTLYYNKPCLKNPYFISSSYELKRELNDLV